MKKIIFFAMFLAALFSACNFVEFDPDGQIETDAEKSQLMLKGALLSDGNLYVQQDVSTSFSLVSTNSNNPLTDASWTIEGTGYTGLNITHIFSTIGDITVQVTATFQSGTTEVRDFTLNGVKDMSIYDPVKIYITGSYVVPSGTWAGQTRYNTIILISKERFANKTAYGYSGNFNDDNPSLWLSGVKIAALDINYIILNGLPTSVGSDIGKYVAIKRELLAKDYAVAPGEFEKADGTGNFLWIDLSGSTFVTASKNVGIIEFRINSNSTITPLGDGYVPTVASLPGNAGDSGDGIFRHELANGKFIVYFNLSNTFTSLTPFMTIKDQETGVWGVPIALTAVADFPNYGKAELLEAQVLNTLCSLRFGNVITNKIPDYAQMERSAYYREPLKELSLTVIRQ
ncbi:MAG TPA: hypothetical protein VFD16_03130 [Candidatus Saccharimonadales bacterium]|nr:hypothetical protein [Candidatus Saccharimonadales bacterium]